MYKRQVKYEQSTHNGCTFYKNLVPGKEYRLIVGMDNYEITSFNTSGRFTTLLMKRTLSVSYTHLQWLSDHMGWATEEQAERVKLLEVQRKKLEVETKEDEEIDDDGFLDAIKNADVGGWTDEEI